MVQPTIEAPLLRASIVILTYNAEAWAPAQIAGLRAAGVNPAQVLVVDSSSRDGSRALFSDYGAEVVTIAQKDFNHGGTRAFAAKLRGESEFLVYMTQDAIPADAACFTQLLRAFDDPQVGMAFGRQLPRPNAGAIEAHARLFNYSARSVTVTLADRDHLGSKATFASDSFAAYRTSTLVAIGGFPENAFFGEDQIVAARMLLAGHAKTYVGDACVYHSHAYTMMDDFRRYFDVGVFLARDRWLTEQFGKPEGEGKRFVLSELGYLARNAPLRIPEAVLRTLFKYAGYRTGLLEHRFSSSAKRRLSASTYYWRDV